MRRVTCPALPSWKEVHLLRNRNSPLGNGVRARLSYANITASLALFIALGGTAAAAVTLPRDSVDAPQILRDGVRSPEIQENAVRSPELVEGSVRTSEIRDKGINFADISTGATTALLGEVGVKEAGDDSLVPVPQCREDLTACPNLLALSLRNVTSAPVEGPPAPASAIPSRNWLVQAKLVISQKIGGIAVGGFDGRCGVVRANSSAAVAVLDEASHSLEAAHDPGETEAIALTAVVPKRLKNPEIALRCNAYIGDQLFVEDLKITALEVGATS